MTEEELEIAKAAYCVAEIWDIYEGKQEFDHMVGLRVKHLIELVQKYQQPSLPSNPDKAVCGVDKEKTIQLDKNMQKIMFDDNFHLTRAVQEGWKNMTRRIAKSEKPRYKVGEIVPAWKK